MNSQRCNTMPPLSIHARVLVESKFIQHLNRQDVGAFNRSPKPMTAICKTVANKVGVEDLIWKALQDVYVNGEFPDKSTHWLYTYFCSSLGYTTTLHQNGTYTHDIKESLKEDRLELKPCAFAEFRTVYHRFVKENFTLKRRVSTKTTSTSTTRQSKRIKKTPAQADQERDEIVQNRAATEKLLTLLKKKGIIQYMQGQKIFYPNPIRPHRRCILRSVYGLVAEQDRNLDRVNHFFQKYCEDLTLFSDLVRVQQVMDSCPVPLEGELIYVGCHWMALNAKEDVLLDDGAHFELLVDYDTAKKAIVEIFEGIDCKWDFLKKKKGRGGDNYSE